MILNLPRLRHFVAIAQEGSFSRAADRLGLSQPALSRSIAQLEQSCGLRLLDRSRAGVGLTAAGENLLVDARQLLGQVDAIEQSLAQQSRGEAGRISLGLGPLAAAYLMTDLLVESLATRPSLNIGAGVAATGDLVAGVLNGSLDFAVCAANSFDPHPALAVRRLGQFRIGYFVRAGHPLAGREAPLAIGDLAPYPRATGRNRPTSEEPARMLFRPLGETVECDDFDVLRRLALRSDAIWLTSDRLVGNDFVELIVDQPEPLPQALIVLVTLHGRTQSPAVRHVIDTAAMLMRR